MPEQPGSFLKFAHVIGNRAVTEFSYRYADNQKACISLVCSTANEAENQEIIADLTKNGLMLKICLMMILRKLTCVI